jgi:hypothetical protein
VNVDERIKQRLNQLVDQGAKVLATRYSRSSPGFTYIGDAGVDQELSHQWGISCLNLLRRVFGEESDHYTRFNALFDKFRDYSPVARALGILKGAREDYENDYLFDTRLLIHAEVFDDFLNQAQYLLDAGYSGPAAVVAGSVLEDGLREICDQKGILLPKKPKLDMMNADLAKSGIYSILVQKRITMLADLRNKAAHGKWNEFTDTDVRQMIDHVRSFMNDHLS